MMANKRKKSWQGYAGFVNGVLDTYYDQDYYGGVTRKEIFKTKTDAKKCYQDVRKVKIEEIANG